MVGRKATDNKRTCILCGLTAPFHYTILWPVCLEVRALMVIIMKPALMYVYIYLIIIPIILT